MLSKGILLSDEQWEQVVGMGGTPFIAYLRERFGLEGDADELIAEKDELYLGFATGRTRVFPAVAELVRFCYVNGYPLAIGSSSRRRVVERMLDEVSLARFFAAVVSSDDVRDPKPSPDIFLEAAARLGVEPEGCLVLDDSQYGVEAAVAAGMRCVALPAEGTGDKTAFSRADFVVAGGSAKLDVHEVAIRFGLGASGRAPSASASARLREVVMLHYDRERREMPWRDTDDPYAILVSEFMLQQTQVARVFSKYEAFLERFPTPAALAEAPLSEVLSTWSGLGYNRRAKNLRESARILIDRFGGRVPADRQQLQLLPGVGPYTASAVCAFAFGSPVVVLETNIRRVVIHFFFAHADRVADRDVEAVLEAAMPMKDIRDWYYALMDYGSYLGRILANPNRRSASYARQSAFEGSVRQVRGAVVRALSGKPELPIEELERALGPTDDRLAQALAGLERDGMIEVDGRRVRLR